MEREFQPQKKRVAWLNWFGAPVHDYENQGETIVTEGCITTEVWVSVLQDKHQFTWLALHTRFLSIYGLWESTIQSIATPHGFGFGYLLGYASLCVI